MSIVIDGQKVSDLIWDEYTFIPSSQNLGTSDKVDMTDLIGILYLEELFP